VWRLVADPTPTNVSVLTAGSTGEGFVGYVVTQDGSVLCTNPGEPGAVVAEGLIFPVTLTTNRDYEVLDNCNRPGWVSADQVAPGFIPSERVRQMDRSVFVIDPGHGAPDPGAVGPSGLTEAEANIDVSARVVELLGTAHDIDWASGAVTSGNSVPAAAVAVMTRSPDGPNGGDYELGLTFRATMGNAVDATALVSIHHNTEPTMDLDFPGTSAFVSVSNEQSPRLGGLIVDEVRRSFSEFEADWVGGPGSGLVARVGADGEDFYSILARSEQPAVIVEGAYISNQSEEALIMTDAFRQAYAEGVYRALVRFVITDDYPIPAPEPELFDVEAPPRSMDDCVVPH
jgi:N-acetylmuramoyl-L-alanine amidase